MEPQRTKLTLKMILNPVTLLTSIIILSGLILVGLVVVNWGRNPRTLTKLTPVMTKIVAPTLTPEMSNVIEEPNPTSTSVFFLPEGTIGVGGYVQVAGTGGAGLRMRAQPSLEGAINFTAFEAEVFLVIDGPVEADGYIWWLLEAPYDKTRNGWSVGDFLTVIEEEGE